MPLRCSSRPVYEAELALHKGHPAARMCLWSRNEPVSVLGAWRNAFGQQEIDDLLTYMANSFSNCASFTVDLLAYDVIGDMALHRGFRTHQRFGGRQTAPTPCASRRRTAGSRRVASRPSPRRYGRRVATAAGVGLTASNVSDGRSELPSARVADLIGILRDHGSTVHVVEI